MTVNGRTDEHNLRDPLGTAHRQLDDELTSERVRNHVRWPETEGLNQAREVILVVAA